MLQLMLLRDSIHRVDHGGVGNRKRGRLRRRTYNVSSSVTVFKTKLKTYLFTNLLFSFNYGIVKHHGQLVEYGAI